MTDPFSAGALEGTALTEGIKFLYQQAGEVLRYWRERREQGGASTGPATLCPPDGLLDGPLARVGPLDGPADRLVQRLQEKRRQLAVYADGIEVPQPDDAAVVEQADALRRLLETVYGQRITFRGEQRPPAGPIVAAELNVSQVAGDAAAVRAEQVTDGEIRAMATADRVEKGARLTVVELGVVE